MSIESIRKHPVWQNMSPVKREIMEEALSSGRGKSMNASAGVIMTAMQKMKMSGESFTKEESDILIEELMKGMSAKERAKVEMIRSMIR